MIEEIINAKKHYFCFQVMDNFYVFDNENYFCMKITKTLYDCLNYISSLKNFFEEQKYEKELKFLFKAYEKKFLLGKETPNNIEILSDHAILSFAPIYDCNFRCKYCFGSSGKVYQGFPNSFSPDLVKKMLTSFVFELFPSFKNYRIEFVSGGEPLLNFEAVKTAIECSENIQKFYNKKFNIWLCTNGSIFNKKWLHYLNNHNVRIGLSLDGNAITHDANRIDLNRKGTYHSVINNYNKIKNDNTFSKNFRDVWCLSVISEQNCDLVSIIKHHYNYNFNSIQMKIIRGNNKIEFINRLKEQYTSLAKFLLITFKENCTDYINLILNENDYFGKIILRIITGTKINRRCQAGRVKLTICPNGDIYPCDSFVGMENMKIGEKFNCLFKKSNFMNYSINERSTCRNCEYRYLCGGDCFYNSFINTGSISTPDPLFCDLNKHLCNLAVALVCEMKNAQSELFNKLCKEAKIRELYRRV